ncbi:MAG: multiubiquitin domain-containing protein [Hyphomonadaceae bacterium]
MQLLPSNGISLSQLQSSNLIARVQGELKMPPEGTHSISVAGADLNFRTLSVADPTPTGRQILSLVDARPFEEHVVLQWLHEGDVEEVRADEPVDLNISIPARFIVAKADRLFRFVFDDRSISWPEPKIEERTLRVLGQLIDGAELYVRRENEPDALVPTGGHVRLGEAGVENIYSKLGHWKLNVQGVEIESSAPMIGVRKAIQEAGFNPDQGWIIVLKTASSKRQVTLEDTIDLREPGIEKLRLTPREINNGETPTNRRQFSLRPEDHAGLDARKLHWETIVDGGRRWLLLHGYPLPVGYNVNAITIAVEVPPSYPAAELDMFYCHPELVRTSGHAIPQTEARQAICGATYQRWSRHRGPNAPWRMGVDSVLTHLALIDAALAREVDA